MRLLVIKLKCVTIAIISEIIDNNIHYWYMSSKTMQLIDCDLFRNDSDLDSETFISK